MLRLGNCRWDRSLDRVRRVVRCASSETDRTGFATTSSIMQTSRTGSEGMTPAFFLPRCFIDRHEREGLSRVTYDLTMAAVAVLSRLNPGHDVLLWGGD